MVGEGLAPPDGKCQPNQPSVSQTLVGTGHFHYVMSSADSSRILENIRQNLNTRVNLIIRNRQRRQETYDIFTGGEDEKTRIERLFEDVFGRSIDGNADHHADAADFLDARGSDFADFPHDIRAFLVDFIEEIVGEAGENIARGRAGDGICAERRAVHTAGEGFRALFACDEASDGETAAEAFCGRDDIGLNSGVHIAEELTAASDAGLDFVDDEEDILIITELLHLTEVIVVKDIDAALALHDLKHDCADVIGARVPECVEIAGLAVPEAFGEGEEELVEDVLTGSGEGSDGTAMEGLVHGDDGISAVAVLIEAVLSCELDCALIGFRTGVAEEHAGESGSVNDDLRGFGSFIAVVIIADMLELIKLGLYVILPAFVVPSEDIDADSAGKIDIRLSVLIGNPCAASGLGNQLQPAVRIHNKGVIRLKYLIAIHVVYLLFVVWVE